MNDREVIWIWLQDCLGFNKSGIGDIFDVFEKPEDIFFANEKMLRETKLFTEHMIWKLTAHDLRYARKIASDCRQFGYRVISLFDEEYPRRLRQIDNAPVLLYVNGTLPDTEHTLCAAIAGSREAASENRKIAFDVAAGLAMHGTIVISGGAEGIDTEAHMGALCMDGITVCVLGCGLNQKGLLKNKKLRKAIAEKGAIISEYPPYMESKHYTFIQRNRIMAGICDCAFIAQAGKNSGSLSMARDVLQYGRKLFVAEPSLPNFQFDGIRELLQNDAEPITNHTEILDWYAQKTGHVTAPLPQSEKKEKNLQEQLTENALMVYHTISDVPVDADDISEQVALDMNRITAALTELELSGLVQQIAGKRYIRK